MPGAVHDITTVEFSTRIRAKIAGIPRHSPFSVVGVGAGSLGSLASEENKGTPD